VYGCVLALRTRRLQPAVLTEVTVAEEWRRGDYTISTDPARLDLAAVHDFLTHSYWAEAIPIEIVARSIENSLPFGIYQGERQVGFARVVTDRATFAYIGDVFVLEEFRGRGLSKWLMETMIGHPELQGLRRWILATADAHGLYRQFGFGPPPDDGVLMQILRPDMYRAAASA
jgi:GNAT superfamily N-acetyltransferase